MYYPSLKDFLKLSKQGNVIPVYKQVNADLDTPVSAFLKLRKDDYAFLLESVEGQEKIARYSFLGSNPSFVFRSKGRNIEIIYPHKKTSDRYVAKGEPLEEIKKLIKNGKLLEAVEKNIGKLEEPENYEKLLATPGVGPKTIRALALVSEVIYGAKPSYEDPARYSYDRPPGLR